MKGCRQTENLSDIYFGGENAAAKVRNVCVYYAGNVNVGTMMRQFVQVGSEREV